MQRLQRSREVIEERSAADRVRKCVNRRDEEVEGDAPIRQDGEVGEGFADFVAAALGFMCAGPTDDEESGRKGVDGLR